MGGSTSTATPTLARKIKNNPFFLPPAPSTTPAASSFDHFSAALSSTTPIPRQNPLPPIPMPLNAAAAGAAMWETPRQERRRTDLLLCTRNRNKSGGGTSYEAQKSEFSLGNRSVNNFAAGARQKQNTRKNKHEHAVLNGCPAGTLRYNNRLPAVQQQQ